VCLWDEQGLELREMGGWMKNEGHFMGVQVVCTLVVLGRHIARKVQAQPCSTAEYG